VGKHNTMKHMEKSVRRVETALQHPTRQPPKLAQPSHPTMTTIRAMYGMRDCLDHQDKAILDGPMTEILPMSPATLQKWVFRTDQFIRAGIARAKRCNRQKTTSISQYFAPLGNQLHLAVATLIASPVPLPTSAPRPKALRQSAIALFHDRITSQLPDMLIPKPPSKPRVKSKRKHQKNQPRTTINIASLFTPKQPPSANDSTSQTYKSNLCPP
jgi:hypothetical protein